MDTTVIPVTMGKKNRVVVVTHELGSENKLDELKRYLLKSTPFVTQENLMSILSGILKYVTGMVEGGSHIMQVNFGVPNEERRLIFVIDRFSSAGMTFHWKQMEDDIDGLLDRVELEVQE